MTIQYSGSAKQTTKNDDPAYGHSEISVTWDLYWTGRLSQLAVPYISPDTPPNMTVRSITGSYTSTNPPPNQAADCSDKLVAGPYQAIRASETNGDIKLQVVAPLTLMFTRAFAQIVAEPAGSRSCLQNRDGSQPNSRIAVPPPTATSPQPDIPYVTYDLAKDARVWTENLHPTIHANGQTDHWDFESTLTISGTSCAKNRTGPGCEPQIIALNWARAASVVRDQANAPAQTSGQFTPDCVATKITRAEYVACPTQKPKVLRPSKNWPVLVTGGTRAEFRNVWVYIPPAPFPSVRPRLKGTASIDGKKLTFTATNGRRTRTADWWRFDSVRADSVWPQKILNLSGKRMLSIRWELEVEKKGSGPFPAGTTKLVAFVSRLAPRGGAKPDLSLVYPAARDANGATSDDATLKDTWKMFAQPARQGLHRYDLNPVTGAITTGSRLQFWPTGWSPFAEFAKKYEAGGCAVGVEGLLSVGVATCRGFAEYQAAMLRLFGISADPVAPTLNNGYVRRFADAQFFLTGKWLFQKAAPAGAVYYDATYPYVIGFHYPPRNGGVGGDPTTGPADEVVYQDSTGEWNRTPPGMWASGFPLSLDGDHALTRINGADTIYDPSFGAGPFKDVRAWMKTQIVGWARVVDENRRTVLSVPTDCGTVFAVCYLLIHKGRD